MSILQLLEVAFSVSAAVSEQCSRKYFLENQFSVGGGFVEAVLELLGGFSNGGRES